MTSNNTLEYLAECIKSAMSDEYATWEIRNVKGNNLEGYGKRHTKRFPTTENVLFQLTSTAICNGNNHLFLIGDGDGFIYAYNGRYFEKITERIDKILKEVIRRAFRALNIGLPYQTDTAQWIAKECAETLLMSDEYVYIPNKRYIAFNNGIFDLKDGKLKKPKLEYRPYIVLNDLDYMDNDTCYREGAKLGVELKNPCNLWKEKVHEIFPNRDMRLALQQWCGALLADRSVYKQEQVCYIVGTGANGKSVFADVLCNVFGEQYFSRFTPRQLFSDSDRGANIAAMRGVIANFVGDIGDKDLRSTQFKSFASGEPFQGRVPYSKTPIKVCAPPLLCCANSLPESEDDSDGNHRRFLIIKPTETQFTGEKRDTMLTHKLSTPLARVCIFNWIYEGYRAYVRNQGAIEMGEDVVEAIKETTEKSNSMRKWWAQSGYTPVQNPTRTDKRWRKLQGDLYKEYKSYCADTGETAMTQTALDDMLQRLGFSKDNGNRRRMPGYIEYCIELIENKD